MIVGVLASNKTTADKMPLMYICPVCGKKYNNRSVMHMFHSVNYRKMRQLQVKLTNFGAQTF